MAGLEWSWGNLERSDAQDFLIEFHPEEIQALSGTMECSLQKLTGCGFQRYRLSDTSARHVRETQRIKCKR
jgi:hypothetical protein